MMAYVFVEDLASAAEYLSMLAKGGVLVEYFKLEAVENATKAQIA
jgi:hypothetical protein